MNTTLAMPTAAQSVFALRMLCRTTAAVALLALTPANPVLAQVKPASDSAPLVPRAGDAAWARADALVKQMTLDEKITYLHGLFPPMTKTVVADMIPSAGYVPGVARRLLDEVDDDPAQRRRPGRRGGWRCVWIRSHRITVAQAPMPGWHGGDAGQVLPARAQSRLMRARRSSTASNIAKRPGSSPCALRRAGALPIPGP